MKPNLGIPDDDCKTVVTLLNTLLADETVLTQKTRGYHWNVVGPQFHDLHVFFGKQYDQLAAACDDVAERARALGGAALGTLAEIVEQARIEEEPGAPPNARDMITNLLVDHEELIQHLRRDVDAAGATHRDVGTADFLTGVLEMHEKMAWMLRAQLEG